MLGAQWLAGWGLLGAPRMGHMAAGLGASGSTGPGAQGCSFWELNMVQCWG